MMSAAVKLAGTATQPLLRQSRANELQAQIAKMLRRLRVAVIYAGSKETAGAVLYPAGNARSWKSYEAVARDIAASLKRLGANEVVVIPEDMNLGQHLRDARSHLAWLNSGGVQGFSSIAHGPAMLEMLGVPYVGHDPMAAAMMDAKHVFKRQLASAGFATPPFIVWHPAFSPPEPRADHAFSDAFAPGARGFVVKPVSGRASLNVHFVQHANEIRRRAEEVFEITGNHVLIEKFMPGREFCVAVAGPIVSRGRQLERLPAPFAFAVLERNLEPDEPIFTSMDVKPITSARARPLAAAAEPMLYDQLTRLARSIFLRMGLEGLVRLDVRQDERGQLQVLEANPKPDLKAPAEGVTSLICLGLEAERMDYDDLIFSLLAHRVDTLFAQQRGVAHRLLALL